MFIKPLVQEKGILHFTLIDPDKQTPQKAAEVAARAEACGSDGIMIGGSTAGYDDTNKTTEAIKQNCTLPTILFPSNAEGISEQADYIFWMMLMNSQDRRFLVGEQMKAAPYVKKLGIKTIPMGYIVVSTSARPTTVESVGDVDRILPEDMDKVVAYALTAQYYGMECIYLEAGSGADLPIPPKMVNVTKNILEIPVIVGGGIRDPEAARKTVLAGADVVVTGTISEKDLGMFEKIVLAVKG
ncbi:MAG: geranylgeranylglyceryl/heptaprenylglyceryl phosphate synthase [Burkholderiales bacterium]|nr:geranylgeranylglyceryl/heptaprenylglyceryl phosphate synthase [Nitrosomonas sp.]MCP5274984.1 geranylgeranylglyceryl/heptaprenylglyceryl phosphate synthase [Burkholderiales bacterium]